MQTETTGLPKEKPEGHKTFIVRIPEPRVHTNADSLELFDILGYQLVAKKGNYAPGDLAVFIQPDSVVPQIAAFAWLWEDSFTSEDVVPERKRRITVRKFRKEYSEGLLMPLAELGLLGVQTYAVPQGQAVVNEGMDVSDLLGITHWEGDKEQDTFGQSSKAPRIKRRPNSIRGWLRYFYYNTVRVLSFGKMYRRESSMEVPFESPEYDVVAAKAARSGFANTEWVTATEKLHGSNGRFLFLEGTFYIGSHYQWKAPGVPCIFTRVAAQQPWIEEWCRANEGRILYGEVIGDQKGYTYGFTGGNLGFKAFDIWEKNGTWTKPWNDVVDNPEGGGKRHTLAEYQIVPILYTGPADIEMLKSLTDGKSVLDGKTQREGIVVSEEDKAPAGHRRPRQVKRVSNVFLEKDSAEPKK
jgi:hypothetical protein